MKKLAFSFGLLFLFSALIFIACSKDQSSTSSTAAKTTATTQNVSFYLTDDPSFYDSVFVDIKSVSILVDTCAKDSSEHRYFDNNTDKDYGDWVSLSMTPGQYNIRALSNGVDTLLASGTALPTGKIRAIKIILGTDSTDNYLTLNGTTHYLHFGNKDSATIMIPLLGNECQKSGTNNYSLWLDFDIARSIYIGFDRRFYLYPVIRWFIKNTTSTVSGNVTPYKAYPVIMAYNATDTAYAIPNRGGNFKIPRLSPGTYSIHIWSVLPNTTYKDTTITNVTATAGNNSSIGSIVLHQ